MKLRPFKKRCDICPLGYFEVTAGRMITGDKIYYIEQKIYDTVNGWHGFDISTSRVHNAKIFRKLPTK